MANLETKYLGLNLKNPIIIGSSELTNSVEKIVELEKAGAGAVVLKSLFEEQILMDIDAERINNISGAYDRIENHLAYYLKKHSVDEYLNLIKDSKKAVNIPVIASINCYDDKEWIDFAKKVEQAGADALEVNLFALPANATQSGREMEQMYLNVIIKLMNVVKIPISLKLSSYFSGLANFLIELSKTKIESLVLFNKFHTPAIDIESEKFISGKIVSTAIDNANTLRWIAILSGQVDCDLAASTGIHTAKEVISNILVGAHATQMVSSIMENGNKQIATVLSGLEAWMDKKEYESIDAFRGSLNQINIKNPMMLERSQFMKYFSDGGK